MSSGYPGEFDAETSNGRKPKVDFDLLELEKYIHDIWEFLPVPICQISPRGVILDTDRAFEKLLGSSKDALIGTLLSDYFPNKHGFEDVQETTLTKGSVSNYRAELRSKQQRSVIVYVSTLVRRDEEKQCVGYFASFIDVTEQEKVDAALRESEEKYSMLFHNSNDAIFLHDLNGNIIDVNQRVLDEFGYTQEEFLKLNISDIHPRGSKQNSKNAFETIAKEGVVNFEIEFRRKDGSVFPAEVSSSLFELKGEQVVQGIVRNVTERKLAMEALKESEEKYRNVVEHSLQGIVVVQGEPIRIRFANTALSRIFGYSVDEMVRFSPEDIAALLYPEDRGMALSKLMSVLAGSPPSPRNQIRIRRKDGSVSWIEIFGNRLQYEGDPAVQVSVVDITDRKRIEGKLKESEGQYRNLVEQSLVGIIIAQVAPFKIHFANAAASHTFGYTQEEFVTLPPEEIQKRVHPEDLPLVFKRFRALMEGDVPRKQEIRIQKKDNTERWVEIFGHRIEREGRAVLQVTVLDITERRDAERARLESELRYRVLFEKSPLSITIIDTSGKVTNCNSRTEEIVGFSREEIVGKRFDELLTLKPETLPMLQKNFEKLSSGGEVEPFELEIIQKDGTKRTIQVTNSTVMEGGRIIGFQIISIDISGRKKTEDALRESEEKYRLLLEQSGDIIAYFNEDGICLAMNRNAAKGLAGSPEEFVGRHLKDMFEEDLSVEALKRIRRLISSGKTEEHEDIVQLPGGKGWFRSSYHIVRGAKGDIIGVQILSRDITERKKMEEELQRSERMKLLAQLAIGVSHEVRNPLGAILASTEALCHDLEGHSEYSEYLSHIRIQVNRLSTLMKDLLELGKPIEEATFENESLQMICSSGVELWKQSTTYKNHKMRFAKPEGLKNIIVRADGSRLQQVCINLLENAAQNSPEGSTITLRILEPENGLVRILVVDEGSGIQAENLKRVFEPFFSTRKQGSGLGLSIVKRIVETHGGIVEIRNNEEGTGCTAEIQLPVIA